MTLLKKRVGKKRKKIENGYTRPVPAGCNHYLAMEAKLSKLQRWILAAAYQKIEHLEPLAPYEVYWEKREEVTRYKDRLTRHEILMSYFKLPDRKPRGWPHSRIIDRKAVGYSTFNKANASMTRALRRLVQRGLLQDGNRYSGRIQLEYEGINLARELKRLNAGEFDSVRFVVPPDIYAHLNFLGRFSETFFRSRLEFLSFTVPNSEKFLQDRIKKTLKFAGIVS